MAAAANSIVQMFSPRSWSQSSYHLLPTGQPSQSFGRYSARASPTRKVTLLLAVAATLLLLLSALRHLVPTVQHDEDLIAFATIAKDVDIDGQFDYSELEALCDSTTWREGLVFRHADNNRGGAGNIRNAFLTGVRFAIEAGAAYVIPRINVRSTKDIADMLSGKIEDFSYLFDKEYFKSSMSLACPQMTIYDNDDIANLEWTKAPLLFNPGDLDETLENGYVILHPKQWRSKFDAWFTNTAPKESSGEEPVLVQLEGTLCLWPIHADTMSVVRALGQTIRPREDVRDLAGRVLCKLSAQYDLNINPYGGVARKAYMGAHLRTEKDTGASGTGDYGRQTDLYISLASEAKLGVIYVASGDADQVAMFKTKALEETGLIVETKNDLLSPEDLQTLNALSWDQQALVDYEMVLRSTVFAGVHSSTFSINAMLKRHFALVLKDENRWWNLTDDAQATGSWWTKEDLNTIGTDETPTLRDSLNTVIGTEEQNRVFPNSLWP